MTVPETTGQAQPSGQVEQSPKKPEGDNWQRLAKEFSATYDQIVARAGELRTIGGQVLTGEKYQTAVLACILVASGRRSEVTRTQGLALGGLNRESRARLEQVVAEVIAGGAQRQSQPEQTPSPSQPSKPDQTPSPPLTTETAQKPESMDLSKIYTWDALQNTRVVDAYGNTIDTIAIQQQLTQALRANRSSLNNPTQYLNDNFPGLPRYLVRCLSRLCVVDRSGLGVSDATPTGVQQPDAQPDLRSKRSKFGESGPVTYDYSQLTTLADIIIALREDSSRVSAYSYVTNEKIARSLKVLFESSLTEARRTGKAPNTGHLSSELTNHGVTIDHPLRVATERAFTTQVINRWQQEQVAQPKKPVDSAQQQPSEARPATVSPVTPVEQAPAPVVAPQPPTEAAVTVQPFAVAAITEKGTFRKKIVFVTQHGGEVGVDKKKLKQAVKERIEHTQSPQQGEFRIEIGRDQQQRQMARIVGTDASGTAFDARLGVQAFEDLRNRLGLPPDQRAAQAPRSEVASQKDPIVVGKDETDMKKNAKEIRLPNGIRMVFGSDEGANYKDHNEDGLVVDPQTGIVTVLDGMGGQGIKNAGMIATEIISQELARTRPTDAISLQSSLVSASRAIDAANLGGGGSTLMSVRAEQRNGKYDVQYSFCGDSGLVMIDASGKVAAYEGGHSLVGDLVNVGEVSDDEALYHQSRNLVTRAVDHSVQMKPWQIEHKKMDLPKGSRLVIGSDGLTDNLTPEEIASIVKGKSADQAYNDLVDVVKARMTNANDILEKTGKKMGGDWFSARASQGKFADGYRSQPKPDNLTIVVVDLP